MGSDPAASSRRDELAELLAREARLLDEQRYDTWLDLLAEDYRYVIPQVIVAEGAEGPSYDHHAYLVMDSKASMRHKLSRRSSPQAWAMNPPSIEHRLIGSVAIEVDSDEVTVRSVVLVAYSRSPDPVSLFPAARTDRLRLTADGWRFTERIVHIASEVPDATALGVIY